MQPLGDPVPGDRPGVSLVDLGVAVTGVADVLVAREQVGLALRVAEGGVDALRVREVVPDRAPGPWRRHPPRRRALPAERARAARPVAADDPLGACGVDERGVDPGELGELPGQRAQRHGDAVLEREGRPGVAPHRVADEQVDVPVRAGQERVEGRHPGRQRQSLRELPDEVLVAEGDLGLHAGQAELRREQGEPDEPPVQRAERGVRRLGRDVPGDPARGQDRHHEVVQDLRHVAAQGPAGRLDGLRRDPQPVLQRGEHRPPLRRGVLLEPADDLGGTVGQLLRDRVQEEEDVHRLVAEALDRVLERVVDVEEVGDAVRGQGQVRGEVAGERQLRDQEVDLVRAEPELGERRRVEVVGLPLDDHRRDALADRRLGRRVQVQPEPERAAAVSEVHELVVGDPPVGQVGAVELGEDPGGERGVGDVREVGGAHRAQRHQVRVEVGLDGVEDRAAVRVELQREVQPVPVEGQQRTLADVVAVAVDVAVDAEVLQQVRQAGRAEPEACEDRGVEGVRRAVGLGHPVPQPLPHRGPRRTDVRVDPEVGQVLRLREELRPEDGAVRVEVPVEDKVVVQLGPLGRGQAGQLLEIGRQEGRVRDLLVVPAEPRQQPEERLAEGAEVAGQRRLLPGCRQGLLDHEAVAVEMAAEDQVGVDLLLDVVGESQPDEVPLLDHREAQEAGVGGGDRGVGVGRVGAVQPHDPRVARGDGPVAFEQDVVDDPGGPRAEPVGHEDLGSQQDGLELLVEVVQQGDRRGVVPRLRSGAEDRGELRAGEVRLLHPPDHGDDGLHQPQPVRSGAAREDPVAVGLLGRRVDQEVEGVAAADGRVGVQGVQHGEQLGGGDAERGGQRAHAVEKGERGRAGLVVERARLPQGAVAAPEPAHDLAEVGLGQAQRADEAAAELRVAGCEEVAPGGEHPVAPVGRRDELRPADDGPLDLRDAPVERPVEQVGGCVAVAEPEGLHRGDEAAGDVHRNVERRRQVLDDRHRPDRPLVQDVVAQAAQHEVEVGERQPGDAGEPDEPVDTVEPPPRLRLRTLVPDERVLVGAHPDRRTALVHEEGRRHDPLGPAPAVDGPDAQPAEEQLRQLGGREAGHRQEAPDRLEGGELGSVEPVVGLDVGLRPGRRRDQLGDLPRQPQVLASDDVRIGFGRELPVEPLRGDTGELEVLPPAQVGQ